MSGQGKRLMVMAGGTGGHVFPGLAVAHHLMAQGWQVRWLGTADRMEADLVPKHGIEIDFIRISGLRGKGIKALIAAPLRIFNAWRQALFRFTVRHFRHGITDDEQFFTLRQCGIDQLFMTTMQRREFTNHQARCKRLHDVCNSLRH